jgi:hypothetical protein
LGQPLSKELCQFARFHIREHWFLFDVLQIFGQQVHHPMSNFAKFPGFHESTWYFILMQDFLKILIDRERNRHAEIAAWDKVRRGAIAGGFGAIATPFSIKSRT